MKRMTRNSRKNDEEPPPELQVVNRTSKRILNPLTERKRRQKDLEATKKPAMDGKKSQLDKLKKPDPKSQALKIHRTVKTSRKKKSLSSATTELDDDPERSFSNEQIVEEAMDLMSHAKVDYRNPPPGVLGAGKGTHGLPEFEFRSIWQKNMLPDINGRNPAPWLQDPVVPPDDLVPTILSVVASVSLGAALDLDDISKRGDNLSYDPDSFTPLVMRLKKPKSTALVFKSGKMVVTGTKSEAECRIATRRTARIIQKLGYRVSVVGMMIENISATCNLGFRVRVHLFGGDKLLSRQIGYHPELFTGVSIPLIKPKVKVMIFRTGSVLLTGAKKESELHEAIRIVYPFAKMYAN